MEQIKSFVQLLQRQHFWLLCVVAMITGMTGWFLATNGLSEEYDTQIKKIQDTKSKMEPGEVINGEVGEGIGRLCMLYDRYIGRSQAHAILLSRGVHTRR